MPRFAEGFDVNGYDPDAIADWLGDERDEVIDKLSSGDGLLARKPVTGPRYDGFDSRGRAMYLLRLYYPDAYEEWQSAVGAVGKSKVSQQQMKHFAGTAQYDRAVADGKPPSYFIVGDGSERLSQKEINELMMAEIASDAGNGFPGIDFGGKWDHTETVELTYMGGWDERSSSAVRYGKIHYANGRVHIVPKYFKE